MVAGSGGSVTSSVVSADAVLAKVSQTVRGVLGADIGSDEPLMAAGVDSLSATELRNSLSTALGVHLPATLVFDHPTIGAMAAFVTEQLVPEGPAGVSGGVGVAGGVAVSVDSHRSLVYIVGAAGPRTRLLDLNVGRRGESGGSCVDGVVRVPHSRWDSDKHSDALPYGGFLEHADMFDAQLFGVSAGEAALMDPQQRLLLDGVLDVLMHHPVDSNTAVHVGIALTEYMQLGMSVATAYNATGGATSVAPGRISYTFGLHGPALSVDTACSSSLVATHLACAGLNAGSCDAGLACGVNLTLVPDTTVMFARAGMLAADGRCKTLDASADGYVRGEGCEVLLLSRERGDAPLCAYAVVLGSAVNQDGRSSSLTAPHGPSQQRVILAALRDGAISAARVDALQLR
jgi:acyl carrier protein